jgi:hypothetical protein
MLRIAAHTSSRRPCNRIMVLERERDVAALVESAGHHRLRQFGGELGEIDHRRPDRRGGVRLELAMTSNWSISRLIRRTSALSRPVRLASDRVELEEQDGHRILEFVRDFGGKCLAADRDPLELVDEPVDRRAVAATSTGRPARSSRNPRCAAIACSIWPTLSWSGASARLTTRRAARISAPIVSVKQAGRTA